MANKEKELEKLTDCCGKLAKEFKRYNDRKLLDSITGLGILVTYIGIACYLYYDNTKKTNVKKKEPVKEEKENKKTTK